MGKIDVKITKQELIIYYVMLAFLFPRGYSELFSQYKVVYTGLLWSAVFIIWIQCLLHIINNRIIIRKRQIAVSLYFIIAIIVTFFSRESVTSGLQQMIAYPSICLFVFFNFKKYKERFLDAIINIFLIEYILNFVFYGAFSSQIHLTFLGHVQTTSQMGILSIFVCVLSYMMNNKRKYKPIILIVVTFITMFVTDADSALLSAIVLICFAILYRWKLYHILNLKSEKYVIIMFIFSVFIVFITVVNNVLNGIIPSSLLIFNGRNSVWQDALVKITAKPIFGYGIDGVLISTFWTVWQNDGFNYAHNQIIQNLLDGGIVLCISFWLMLLTFAKSINRVVEKQYRILSNGCLIVLLLIMVFDSPTLYCYMFILLTIIFALPHVLAEKRETNQQS